MWIIEKMARRALPVLLALSAVVGCQRHLARQVKFSPGVRAAYDISCPETRIEVEAQHVFGNDRVYVLDACGTKVELEHGLRVPPSLTSIEPLTKDEITELVRQLTSPHMALAPLVKQELRVWCHEGDALMTGESPEQCHARLSAALVPLGRGPRPRDSEEHWFAIGQRVFRAWAVLAQPPCEHLVLKDTPAACRCRGSSECPAATEPASAKIKLPRESAGAARDEPSFPVLYGRVEIGLGHARLSVGDNARYRGLGIAEAAFIGAWFAPQLTLTAGISNFNGFTTQPYSRDICSDDLLCDPETGDTDVDHLALWMRSNVYPFGSGLHLDAGAGYALGLQYFVVESTPRPTGPLARLEVTGGPALSLGAGYEGMISNRWYLGVGGRQIWFVGSELKGSATEGFVTVGMRVD